MRTNLPPRLAPCWRRLAEGGLLRLDTDHLGVKMMRKRIELSPASMDDKCQQIFIFFQKWEHGLAHEIAQIEYI